MEGSDQPSEVQHATKPCVCEILGPQWTRLHHEKDPEAMED